VRAKLIRAIKRLPKANAKDIRKLKRERAKTHKRIRKK